MAPVQAENPANKVDAKIANMDESIALPRANGELVFAAPWEARAFGLAVALNEAGVYPWRDFSEGLARQIAIAEANEQDHAAPPTSYYARWLANLQDPYGVTSHLTDHRKSPEHEPIVGVRPSPAIAVQISLHNPGCYLRNLGYQHSCGHCHSEEREESRLRFEQHSRRGFLVTWVCCCL